MNLNQRRILIIAGIVLVIGVIIYFTVIKPKTKTTAPAVSSGSTSASDNTGVTYVPPASMFPLKMGSVGKPVEQLQEYLQYQYNAQFPQYGIDGNWGAETDANVQKYLNRDNVSLSAYNQWGLSSYLTTVYP